MRPRKIIEIVEGNKWIVYIRILLQIMIEILKLGVSNARYKNLTNSKNRYIQTPTHIYSKLYRGIQVSGISKVLSLYERGWSVGN